MISSNGQSIASPLKGRCLHCKVKMLDDTEQIFQVPLKSKGFVLFNAVIDKLNLIESDYFDLQYNDSEFIPCWLDHEKMILKQVPRSQFFFKFLLKFYTPDPGLLEEEHTRYLLALQIKRDLLAGDLLCQEHTAILLASYIVQAEVGDFKDEYEKQNYISQLQLLPNHTSEIEMLIMERHKEHIGQTPAEADFNLLDTARKVELYGIQLHAAQDLDRTNLHLAISHSGILVFQNLTKINSFSWPKLRKLCFKRRKFIIKLHGDGLQEGYKDTVEFIFPSRNWSKNFWKKCIEHHTFFRCHHIKRAPRVHTKVISNGSSFRYCGRTQKELTDYAREKAVKPIAFERTTSMRTMSALQSRAGSPRSGTLNSRDLSYYGSHNLEAGQHDGMVQRRHHSTVSEAHFKSFPTPESSSLQRPHQPNSVGSLRRGYEPRAYTGRDFEAGVLMSQNNNGQMYPISMPNGHRLSQKSPNSDSSNQGSIYNAQSQLDPAKFMLRQSSIPQQQNPPQDATLRHVAKLQEVENLAFKSNAEFVNGGTKHYMRPQTVTYIQEASSQQQPPTQTSQYLASQHDQQLVFAQHLPPQHHQQQALSQHLPLQHQLRSEPIGATTCPQLVYNDLPSPPVPLTLDESPRRPRARSPFLQSEVGAAYPTGLPPRPQSRDVVVSPRASDIPQAALRHEFLDEEGKKKQKPTLDEYFYFCKEILMTGRTYQKDLEIISVCLYEAMKQDGVMPEPLIELFFLAPQTIYESHFIIMADLEQRIAAWEGKLGLPLPKDERRIGDILVKMISSFEAYESYLSGLSKMMLELDTAMRKSPNLERAVNEFESCKISYLPLNSLLLKPAQRILYLHKILNRILSLIGDNHIDTMDIIELRENVSEISESFSSQFENIENLQKLIELQRGLIGVDNLLQHKRSFVREGCLQKLSRRGCQQRMFFLLSDQLIYTSRMSTPSLQFKVHGQLALKGLVLSDDDARTSSLTNGFAMYSSENCVVVAAASSDEKDKWMRDLQAAIEASSLDDAVAIQRNTYPSLKSNSSSEALDDSKDEDMKEVSPQVNSSIAPHRANNTMHVCWHRGTSVSLREHCISLEHQLSGYLLRKFKNSSGWQKLWVVFTNFCLFFYKSYQDEYPLASLPLLSYSIGVPAESDAIGKEHVFKLQFKNHIYFFRAESLTTFNRWLEVIGQVTSSTRTSLEE